LRYGSAHSGGAAKNAVKPSVGDHLDDCWNAAAGLADVHLVAPFFRTIVGTDAYVDELW
jgi:hypothetical protein